MSSEFLFYNNPFFWILLTALFFGAALSRISRSTARAHNPEKARTRKWVMICLYLSLSMIFLVCCIFIPGPVLFLNPQIFYAFMGGSLLFFLIFRFKKAVGLPFFSLSILFIVLFLLFLQAITAFTGETQIASVRVLESGKDKMKLEVAWDKQNPYASDIIELEGQFFAPVAKLVIFEDYLVFFGAKSWYRLLGFRAFALPVSGEMTRQSDEYPLKHPQGISPKLFEFIEKNEAWLPGIKTTQIGSAEKKAEKAATYLVLLQNDGGLEIVRE